MTAFLLLYLAGSLEPRRCEVAMVAPNAGVVVDAACLSHHGVNSGHVRNLPTPAQTVLVVGDRRYCVHSLNADVPWSHMTATMVAFRTYEPVNAELTPLSDVVVSNRRLLTTWLRDYRRPFVLPRPWNGHVYTFDAPDYYVCRQ